MLSALAVYLALASASHTDELASRCQTFVGQTPQTISFSELRARLPAAMQPRGAYESTDDYRARLAAAPTWSGPPVIVASSQRDREVSYNADDRLLTIWETAFTLDFSNYSSVTRQDPQTGTVLAFNIDFNEVDSGQYQASNAYGAITTVRSRTHEVNALLEPTQARFTTPFLGVRPFSPVARLPMAAADAQRAVETRHAAFLFLPQPPYLRTGEWDLAPSYTSPSQRHDTITAAIGDIRCAFLMDGSNRIFFALAVR